MLRLLLGRVVGEEGRPGDPPKGAPEISADLPMIPGGPFPGPPRPKWEGPDLGDLSKLGEFAPNLGAAASLAENRDSAPPLPSLA